MKRLTAVLAAALITLTISTTAFAVPENSDKAEQSSTSSGTEQKENSESSKNNTDKTESSTDKTESSVLDPNNITYKEYKPDNTKMTISLPSEMYILTPDIDEDDPALAAANLTKEKVKKSFKENGTLIKAFAKDFSFDITLTMTQNERTQTIDNLSYLSEEEITQITNALLENNLAVGCSKNTYNGTLFLSFDTEYETADAKIYGVQEYTVVNGKNIIITFQSHTGKLSENQQALIRNIMSETVFEGRAEESAEISDASSTDVTNLDPRYIVILISSVVALVALASMIIVGTKYRESHRSFKGKDDDKFIINTPKTRLQVDDEVKEEIKPKKTEKPYDTSIFEASDENVLFTNTKLEEEKKQKEKNKNIPRLDSTMELSIPKNPYTPVGKAEAVEQPAMSVTSEIAKLSNISAEEARKAKEVNAENESAAQGNTDSVVFAESTPKAKTEIKQIGEEVFNTDENTDISEENSEETDKHNEPFNEPSIDTTENKREEIFSDVEKAIITNGIAEEGSEQHPDEELSEYEKRFGRGRKNFLSNSPVTGEEEEKPVSKFEKHFGRLQPAAAKKEIQNDTVAAVDAMIKQENTVVDVKKKEKSDNTHKDDPAITITKAPPKISEPVVTEQPVVRITKTTPMPAEIKEEIIKAEETVPETKEDTTKNNNTKASDTQTTKEKPVNTNTNDEQSEKRNILQKFTEKLFASDEPDELTEHTVETNKESTNKFINSIKDKLQYRAPEYEDEPTAEQAPKTSNEGTEIYHSPEAVKPNRIELAVKKNEDGSIVIDSISDETGKPVQIAVKDGEAELKKKPVTKGKKKNRKSDKKNKRDKKNTESSGTAALKETAVTVAGAAVTAAGIAAESAAESVKNVSDKAEAAGAVVSAVSGTSAKTERSVKTEENKDNAVAKVKTEKTEDKAVAKVRTEETEDKAVAEVKTEGTEDKTVAEVRTEETEDKNVAEVRTEETEDKNVAEVKTEETEDKAVAEINTEKTEDKAVAEVNTEKTEDKAVAEVRTEETEDKTVAEVRTEETEDKAVAEVKTEETEDKAVAEVRTEGTEDKAVAEVKTEETEDKAVAEVKTEETEDKTVAEVKTEETEDKTVAEVRTEETKDKTVDKEVQAEAAEDETVDGKITEETIENTHSDEKTGHEENDNVSENINHTSEDKTEAVVMSEFGKTDTETERTSTINTVEKENINNGKGTETEAEPSAPEFVFERDTGIIFEKAISPANTFTANITPLTSIPKLESVNANDYNKQAEELRKQSVVSFNRQPEPQPEPIQTPAAEEPDSYYPDNEDDTLDPFAPGSGEMTLKEIDKKTAPKLRDRIKKSFGKIFSAGEDEK